MKKFFDYHYYRVAKFNFKREGTHAFSALLSVTSVQLLALLNLFLFFESLFSHHEARKLFLYEKISFLLVFLVLLFINYKTYKKKYFEFREQWRHESKKMYIINGAIVILTIILSWSLIFLNAYIFGRYRIY